MLPVAILFDYSKKKLMLRGSHLFLLAHQPFKITDVSYVGEVLKDSMTKETPGAS